MRTRTQLCLGAAAIGALLTGAAAQTMRDGGQNRSEQSQRQQTDRIQDMNRQKAEPQSAQPAQNTAQPQQQGQSQNQQAPRTVSPNTQAGQAGQNQPVQQPTQGSAQNQQGGAPPSQSQAQPSQSPAQQPSAATQQPRQPSAETQQPPSGQAGSAPRQQPAQPAQPQQAAPSQPQQAQPAQRPAQQTTQSGQRSSSGVVSLNAQQQTQIGRTIARSNVRPLTNVNFSISVGTRVPSSVQLRALSSDLVAFVPQYRGYSYFVVEEQIVIVEPATHEIVTIIPYTGSKATASTGSKATVSRRDTMTNRPVKLNTEQRDVVRKHATERRATSSTTVRKRYVPGDRIDREVTVESFPETVYTEVPSIRRYRYFRDDDDVFLVDPDEDRVVDVIR